MDFLNEVFGQEALTFEQFSEKLGAAENVKLANLKDGGYVDIGKFKTAEADRDSYKGQFEALQATIDELQGKAGNADALQASIDQLKADMHKLQSEHQQEIASRDFNDMLADAVREAKGRNVKAVISLLDMEALRGSQNPREDIAAALKALKASDPYLFENEKLAPPFAVGTGTGQPAGVDDDFAKRLAKYNR